MSVRLTPDGVLVSRREPILNVPPVVTATLAVMAIVHAVRTLLLTPRGDAHFLLLFSFIPARYEHSALTEDIPGGWGADVWTFVTYAVIHADWTHLLLNGVWLLAFGSAVARRFGAARFVAFSMITAAGGAALHLATHAGEVWPMVGASASISGFMAAAIRFIFQANGPLGLFSGSVYREPVPPLLTTLRDPRVIAFLVIWFGLNLLFGIGSISLTDQQQTVAWEAHVGGFLTGLLLFPWFDPVPPAHSRHSEDDTASDPARN
jgi:membrane associated rhomboid family serine protease